MARTISLDTTVVASKDQASADLGDEAAILNLKSGVYYSLDAVGARIWKHLQEPRRVSEVRDMLLEEYDVESSRAEKDLMELLTELVDNGLVDVINSS